MHHRIPDSLPGWPKTRNLALRDSLKKQRKKRARAHDHLSNSGHTERMETSKPGKIVLLIIGVLLLAGWALVIWVAMAVTHTALETLAYIVDLAQYTP